MRRRTWQAGVVLLCGLAGVLASGTQARAQGPVLTGISHNNGPATGGTSLTLTGEGFIAGSTVRVGGAPAASVRIDSPTSITTTTPAGVGTVEVTVLNSDGSSAASPKDQFAYDAPSSALWLGLNGNNSTYLGPVDAFSKHGIVYDRGGPIEWTAGELLQEDGRPTSDDDALATDIRDGMIPVIAIEYRGYEGQYAPDPRFPTAQRGSRTLQEYVEGFVSSASAILASYPGRTILFEPMNEPWGYTKPQFNGAEYADVIAQLLPAARLAHLPLSSIYIAASGRHWLSQMYKAQPALQTEVQGWYFHPYGPASGSHGENSQGIQSLPHVQAEMTSGQNNIIVSEVGYCALDINPADSCGGSGFAHSTEAAQQLTETLNNALPYHEAGWLKALLVYSRNDGGWAMQVRGGELTEQGEAYERFAEALTFTPRGLRFRPFGSKVPGSSQYDGSPGNAADALGDFYVTTVANELAEPPAQAAVGTPASAL
jgi:IPT/TIG domain